MLEGHCFLARYLMQWRKQGEIGGREAPSSVWCSIGRRVPIVSHDQRIRDGDNDEHLALESPIHEKRSTEHMPAGLRPQTPEQATDWGLHYPASPLG